MRVAIAPAPPPSPPPPPPLCSTTTARMSSRRMATSSSSSSSSTLFRKATAYASRLSSHLVSPADLSAPLPPPLQIHCSPPVFRVVWVLIVSFQFALSLGLSRALFSYVWSLLDHHEVAKVLRQFGIQYNDSVILGSVVATVVTTYAHAADVVHSVRHSIRQRRLVLQYVPSSPSATTNITTAAQEEEEHEEFRSRRALQSAAPHKNMRMPITSTLWSSPLWTTYVGPPLQRFRHVFYTCGVHGKYFNVGLYSRELLEIALQTYQTYKVSYAVSESWINNLAVAIVVANCWSTPFLDLSLRHKNDPLRRVLCLSVDIVLDAFAGLVLPFCVYASWRRKLPQMDWYDPLWIMDAGNDLLYFHVNTWLDLVSRLMPGLSMIQCIRAIRAMLKPESAGALSHATQNQISTQTQVIPVVPQPTRKPSRQPRSTASSSSARILTPHLEVPSSSSASSKVLFIHQLLFVYGAVVLAMGIVAQHGPHLTPALPGCLKSTRPWLVVNAKYPCAVLELNCAKDPYLAGDDPSILNDRLLLADASTLSALLIVHCPRVYMPSRLATFRNLLWLELYNSTIVDWPADAALTYTSHPQLSRVLLVHVRGDADLILSRVVLSSDLPHTLLDVAVVDVDLSTASSSFVDSSLSPTTTLRRVLDVLVLQQCELSTITWLSTVQVTQLSLIQNPLVEIQLDAIPHTRVLHVQDTHVMSCSSTTSSSVATMAVYAAQSPLCDHQSEAQRVVSCSSVAAIDCTELPSDGSSTSSTSTSTSSSSFPLQRHDDLRRVIVF